MRLNKRDLEKLRARLPKGFTARVIEEAQARGYKCSAGMVSYVLNGSLFNLTVIEAAIAVAERYEAEMAELAARMRGSKTTLRRVPAARAPRKQAA